MDAALVAGMTLDEIKRTAEQIELANHRRDYALDPENRMRYSMRRIKLARSGIRAAGALAVFQ